MARLAVLMSAKIQGEIVESGEQTVHAEQDQERSGGNGQIRKELETRRSRSARHEFP